MIKKQESLLQGHSEHVTALAVTSDNKYVVSGSADKTIRIWNLSEKKQEAVLKGHLNEVNCVTVTSDNKYIVSGSNDKSIRV